MLYTNQEAFDMMMIYGECRQNESMAIRLYAERHPDRRHFRRGVFKRLADKLRTTGSIRNQRKGRECPEEIVVDVLAAVSQDPHTSTRNIARDRGISQTTVSRVLRENKFHAYHISLLQELSANDFRSRIQFCLWARQQIEENPDFFRLVMWTDEATFKSDGNVNRHNLHYWNDVNPHWMRSVDHQHRWSVNAWAGIVGSRLIGPFF